MLGSSHDVLSLSECHSFLVVCISSLHYSLDHSEGFYKRGCRSLQIGFVRDRSRTTEEWNDVLSNLLKMLALRSAARRLKTHHIDCYPICEIDQDACSRRKNSNCDSSVCFDDIYNVCHEFHHGVERQSTVGAKEHSKKISKTVKRHKC